MLPRDLPDDADTDMRTLHQQLSAVEHRITEACERAGRERNDVRLLPVSKTVAAERLRHVYALGYRWLGENKVQEAMDKAEAMADLDVAWCVIGHLQTNKARHVAQFAAELHSLDSLKLARELDRRLQKADRRLRVLVQVNTSNEDNKSGVMPDDVMALLRELPACDALEVAGFMTLAMASDDETAVRGCFRRLRQVQERARQDAPAGLHFDELSMGMSGDFEWAIDEGATLVRVGSAIFGARPVTTIA